MKIRLLLVIALLELLGAPAFAQAPSVPAWHKDASTLVQHSHTTGATITLPASGLGCQNCFVYVDGIDIANCAGASAVTAAAPTFITTTNLAVQGATAPQYMLGSGVAAGLCQPSPVVQLPHGGIHSAVAGTAVTFVLPAFAANQVVSVTVYYHLYPQ
jgi:hypothetical protein